MGSARAVGASWLVVLACASDARAQFGGAPLRPGSAAPPAATSAPQTATPAPRPKPKRPKPVRPKPIDPSPTDPIASKPTPVVPIAPPLIDAPAPAAPMARGGASPAPVSPPVLAPATTSSTAPFLTIPSAAVPAPGPTSSAPSPVARSRDGSGRRSDARSTRQAALDRRDVTITTPSTPVGTKKKYPRALARRALLLPLGVVQGAAMLTIETVRTSTSNWRNRAFVDPRVRIGIGFGEVELGGSFLAYEPEDMSTPAAGPERFVTAFGAAKIKILPNTALGGELAVRTPVSDARIYAPRVVAATKLRPSPTSAVEVALRAGADVNADQNLMYVASSELRLQAQADDELAIEARGVLAYFRPSDELAEAGMARRHFAQTYGIRIVGGISHELDVIVGFDVTLVNDMETVQLFSFGFAGRRLP